MLRFDPEHVAGGPQYDVCHMSYKYKKLPLYREELYFYDMLVDHHEKVLEIQDFFHAKLLEDEERYERVFERVKARLDDLGLGFFASVWTMCLLPSPLDKQEYTRVEYRPVKPGEPCPNCDGISDLCYRCDVCFDKFEAYHIQAVETKDIILHRHHLVLLKLQTLLELERKGREAIEKQIEANKESSQTNSQ
ncbi:hypothetical protein NHQ30_003962 [Ciborinia camelliae]|nr:hypothetical protein NHQ30_003962 [Ciborinia camelliae]